MNWLEISEIPDPTPKDFEELTKEYQQRHFKRLWEALEEYHEKD